MLPDELALLIFAFIAKVSDKRSFSRTCKRYNKLTKQLVKDRQNEYYGKLYVSCVFVNEHNIHNGNFLLGHTWELCTDGYFDRIPEYYYNKNNFVLCRGLIFSGNVNLLQKAIDLGCELNWLTCIEAATHGFLDIVKLGKEHNRHWNYQVGANAAKNGHLNVLKWAIENGCGWDIRISAMAAYRGHLHILQWIRENGGPINNAVWINAIRGGHLDVIKWGLENGGHICPEAYNRLYVKHPNIILWLKENYDEKYSNKGI
jgi:hypothetical protein